MNITVCVAITPSTDSKVRLAGDNTSLDTSDVKYELNPYDEFALEEALQIKDSGGAEEVSVVTVGDGTQKEEIRKCLARGADKATILKCDISTADSGSIARALSDHIKGSECTLAFLGKQAVDGDNAQVPVFLAHELGWSVVTKVSSFELDGDSFTAHREIEGGVEIIEGSLPAVISAEKGLNEPRFPSLKGIMAAKKKPLEEVEITCDAAMVTTDSLELPPPRPEGRIIGEGIDAVDSLVDLLRKEAKVI